MAYPLVESPHVTRTTGRQIDVVVLHSMENDEKGSSAESCAQWFRNPAARVSAHYCVDADSIVQCVRDRDIAWHAPGANHNGIGIEHAGRARQSRAEWEDAYSAAMLARSAALVASLCAKYRIPVTWLHPADLVAGKRGITSHDNVSKAFKRGTHWDPGPGFPIELYLRDVAARLRGRPEPPGPVEPLAPEPRLLRRGDRGWEVKRLQRLLRAHGLLPSPALVDGVFGEITEAAVHAFQSLHDLEVDGLVGPLTWRALQAAPVVVREREPQPV
jgi:N-acetyl-anhydromuramyl-L-alanine amidase AmpD